jgi:hypothetical protein
LARTPPPFPAIRTATAEKKLIAAAFQEFFTLANNLLAQVNQSSVELQQR